MTDGLVCGCVIGMSGKRDALKTALIHDPAAPFSRSVFKGSLSSLSLQSPVMPGGSIAGEDSIKDSLF